MLPGCSPISSFRSRNAMEINRRKDKDGTTFRWALPPFSGSFPTAFALYPPLAGIRLLPLLRLHWCILYAMSFSFTVPSLVVPLLVCFAERSSFDFWTFSRCNYHIFSTSSKSFYCTSTERRRHHSDLTCLLVIFLSVIFLDLPETNKNFSSQGLQFLTHAK